ncbi:hypothetical protein JZ751_029616 [Albula glossodonta]|uniref:DDE Tnp4 domain-containing protein n=1 Tax=Albula glossodonta TaxID=121402 RepID=A0A8T2NBL4_9TELE|nr:hypothetical protein JZ751_029616 [Albula glossodonta]
MQDKLCSPCPLQILRFPNAHHFSVPRIFYAPEKAEVTFKMLMIKGMNLVLDDWLKPHSSSVFILVLCSKQGVCSLQPTPSCECVPCTLHPVRVFPAPYSLVPCTLQPVSVFPGPYTLCVCPLHSNTVLVECVVGVQLDSADCWTLQRGLREPPAPEQADAGLHMQQGLSEEGPVCRGPVQPSTPPAVPLPHLHKTVSSETLTHSTWRQSFQLTSSSYCSSNSQHMETELPAQCSLQPPPAVPLPHLHQTVSSERQSIDLSLVIDIQLGTGDPSLPAWTLYQVCQPFETDLFQRISPSCAQRIDSLSPSLPRSRSLTNTLITDPLLTYTYDRAVLCRKYVEERRGGNKWRKGGKEETNLSIETQTKAVSQTAYFHAPYYRAPEQQLEIEENAIQRRRQIRNAAVKRRAALRRAIALVWTDQCGVKGLAQGPNSSGVLAVAGLGLEPPTSGGESLAMYGRINLHVPVLEVFFDEDRDLQLDFRLSRQAIHSRLGMLPNRRDHGWGYIFEMLVFIYWLACGTSYRVVSEVFDIPRSTVHRMVHRIADDILKILPRVIRFPVPEDLDCVGEGFARLAQHRAFRKAVGAIDGCHIRIKPPGGVARQCYVNRKLRFLDVFVGYPGSVHDSRLYPPCGYMPLGDDGYPCVEELVTIVTPYREPVQGPVEARFNCHHAKARSVVEPAFGLLKTRWRSVFFSTLEVQPTFAPKVIAACAVLHNIGLEAGDVLEDTGDNEGYTSLEPVPFEMEETPGQRLRAHIAEELSAPTACPASLQDHTYFEQAREAC